MGIAVGFFSVSQELGPNAAAVIARIREICPPSSVAFPFAVSPVEDENREQPMAYAVVRGHVPIHVDRPNANQRAQSLFTFVLEAENRPVLLTSPADRETAKAVFIPEETKLPKALFGALELTPGRAIHFDVTNYFHGITGYPTGDLVPDLPSAVLIQVPHARADDIGGAIETMRRVLKRDDRFADLMKP